VISVLRAMSISRFNAINMIAGSAHVNAFSQAVDTFFAIGPTYRAISPNQPGLAALQPPFAAACSRLCRPTERESGREGALSCGSLACGRES
jgi:hypothetical protein